MDNLNDLNEHQLIAVTTDSQHVRVVAGAGSGKTRVLTYRVCHLINEFNAAPWSILAITFTNKAANEMKKRIVNMIPECEKDLNIKTFHSFAAAFLRREITNIGFPASFTILDEEDQTKLLKDIAFEMGYKRSDKIVGVAQNYISSCKLKEKYPEDVTIKQVSFFDEKTCLEIYTRYEEEKNKILSLDFDDLLLKANYILSEFPSIRMKWQSRISHILVDEFQDTNDVEYKFLNLLLKPESSLYVVGDPDQTIYTWRGANQNIILDLSKRFPDMETIILDRNYRSTQTILDSANKLIQNNKYRVPKNLYTEANPGDPIFVRSAPSSREEASFVAREIKKLVNVDHYKYSDIVILYRSSYVTVDFESALTENNIPYMIYGGLKFYQRREIKDVLAYFHLIVNIKDDISFERIMNVPRRGIGETTINKIKEEAKVADKSIYEYICSVDSSDSQAPSKAINSLKALILLIEKTKEDISKSEEIYAKILEDMIVSIGYYDYLKADDDGEERLENVKALFADIRHFLKEHPDSTFDEYLQNIALLSAQDDMIDGQHVSLMTVHTAKGLEYPIVFLIRFNQGIFPNNRALVESGYKGMEEERRLAYVAITRAMKKLYLTYAGDYSYVLGSTLSPSQFFKESGNEIKNNYSSDYSMWKSPKKTNTYSFDDGKNNDFEPDKPVSYTQDFSSNTNGLDESDWKVGDIVIHKTLGKGVVTALEGDGIIEVNFENHGKKSIMGNHPSVSKGGQAA